jgi:hypothetical protein
MLVDMTDFLFDGPEGAKTTLVLAHGAGAPMDSPFMETFAQGLGERGIAVARFEFPYMVSRRATGNKRPPDRQPILLQTWAEVIARLRDKGVINRLAIGGKSMGGRMATLLATQADPPYIQALVCLGYPFHPAGRPERLRTEHLRDLPLPCLMVQGERDTLGNRPEVEGYALPNAIQFHWCPDGDHSLVPRKRSGFTQDGNWTAAMNAIAEFLQPI